MGSHRVSPRAWSGLRALRSRNGMIVQKYGGRHWGSRGSKRKLGVTDLPTPTSYGLIPSLSGQGETNRHYPSIPLREASTQKPPKWKAPRTCHA